MKALKKGLALLLGAIASVCTFFTGCGGSVDAPDYSDSDADFDIWAYHATYDGWWQYEDASGKHRLDTSDGIVETTKESLIEYKAAGFTDLFISYAYQLKGKDFVGSKVEQVMDWSHELNMKCFLFESTLHGLSSTPESLINPEKANGTSFFATQEDLNAYVYDNIKDIIVHPAFGGFSLKDEPHRKYLPAIGQVYKAIQAAAPGCFVNMNLWAYTTSPAAQWQERYSENYASQTPEQNYIDYLNTYLECTGASYVQYDDYPLQGENRELVDNEKWYDWKNVSINHIKNYEIVAKWAKENNMEVKKVLQACSYAVDNGNGNGWQPTCRDLTKTDMYWQTNIGMAMGQKSFTYWSYYPIVNVGSAELYDNTTCFIDQYGNKNDMYDWMSDIHAEMHVTAKALANFEFCKMTKVVKPPRLGQNDYLTLIQKNSMEIISTPQSETQGIAIVTELYDEENDRYGYYIVNVTDPTEDSEMEISFTLEGYNNAQTYFKGEITNKKLKKNLYEITLATGEGAFVIPY